MTISIIVLLYYSYNEVVITKNHEIDVDVYVILCTYCFGIINQFSKSMLGIDYNLI